MVFCDVYFGIWWFVGFRFYVGTLGFLGVGGGLPLGVVGWYFLWFCLMVIVPWFGCEVVAFRLGCGGYGFLIAWFWFGLY